MRSPILLRATKRVAVAVFSLAGLAFWCNGLDAALAAPAAAWKTSQLWIIQVESYPANPQPGDDTPPTPAFIYVSVNNERKLNGADCFILHFGPNGSNPGPVDRAFYVWVDKQTAWPRKVLQHVNGEKKAAPQEIVKDLGDAAMITGAPPGFPIEVFPIDGPLTRQTPGSPFKLVITREEQKVGNQVVVEARLLKDDHEELRIRQKWVPGETWWREYERFVEGRCVLRARMHQPYEAPKPPDPKLLAFLERTKLLREDRRLGKLLDVIAVDLPLADALGRIEEKTGVTLAIDPALERHEPQFGSLQFPKMPAWRFMDFIAEWQLSEGRWVKDGDGYRLVAKASLRERPAPEPALAATSTRWPGWSYLVLVGMLAAGLALFFVRRPGPKGAMAGVAAPGGPGAVAGRAGAGGPVLQNTWSSLPAGSAPITLPGSVRQLQEQCRREPGNLALRRALRQRVKDERPGGGRRSGLGALARLPARLRLRIARALGRHAGVLYWGEIVVARDPSDVAAAHDMAAAAEALGNVDLALWILGQARQHAPESVHTFAELGRLCEQRGLAKQSLRFWQTVTTLQPDDLHARQKVTDLAALATIDQNVNQAPVRASDAARPPEAKPVGEAAPAVAAEAPERADANAAEVEHLRQHVAEAPADAAGHFELGLRLYRAGQYDEAIRELQPVRSDPTHGWKALLCLGHCFTERGNPRLAQRSFEDCLQAMPAGEVERRKELLYQLAMEHAGREEWPRALDYAYEVANLDFGYRDVSMLLDEWEEKTTLARGKSGAANG